MGEWHLVTFTFSQTGGYALFVDGKQYLSTNLAYTGSVEKDAFNNALVLNHVATSKYFYLGLGSFWGSADACFDDVMIYNRALTSTDVRGLYTMLSRSNPFDDGTIVGIDDVDASSAVSSFGNGATFSLGGAIVPNPHGCIIIKDGKKVLLK